MTNENELLESLAQSLISFDSQNMRAALQQALDSGIPVDVIIRKGLGKGMEIVGEKYEKGEFFLSDLIMSAVVMTEGIEQLKPMLGSEGEHSNARILIGTVEGDLHDIGKNLAKYMLQSAGYEVLDLGTDVPPQRFVQETRANRPDMVCMSALLSVTVPKVKETVAALRMAGLRDNLKILVGGRCLNEEIASEAGADAYGKDCSEGLRKAKELLKRS